MPTDAEAALGPRPAVSCQGLVKRYGALVAVDGISFDVHRGECFGLLGPNGAGKTTTVEMLEGLKSPDFGSVEVLGLGFQDGGRKLRDRIGVQLQDMDLPERLTVTEVLRLFRSFFSRGPSVEALLASVSLEEKRDARVSTLSGGQRQRLSLASALAGDPDVLFLDEPTTGLDPQARLAVWELLERFTSRGGTTLLTTHYMEEAARLCRRVAIIDQGRILAQGSPAELIASTGATQVVEVELSLDRTDEAGFGRLPHVASVHRRGRTWLLASSNVPVTLPALIIHVAGTQDRLVRVTTREPTLEDAFMGLTGRALRDG